MVSSFPKLEWFSSPIGKSLCTLLQEEENNNSFWDFTFRLGPKEESWVKVHKLVVATSSPQFHQVINEALKSGRDYVELKNVRTLFSDDKCDINVFKRLIKVI
jgi:hypothetical protein